MTVGNWIMCIVACVLSCMVGFGFMFWVAKEMVNKVRLQEEQRHQDLLTMTADQAGEWQDIVNDILDAVQMGKLENRSVKDQVKTIQRIITDRDQQETVDLTNE